MGQFWIGLLGVAVGSATTLGGVWLNHHLQTRRQEKIDQLRKGKLLKMLQNPPAGTEWRSFTTLSRVIGADRETTTRLLIEIGARGSEKEEDVWALESSKPLP